MKKTIAIVLVLLTSLSASAQMRKVQNRPYADLRPFHFGIQIGTHFQDMDFINVGPQTLTDAEGNEQQFLITADQDRFDPGFNVGVLGEFRLTEHLQFRIAPAIYFGSRHVTFLSHHQDEEQRKTEVRQNIKAAYITSTFDLIFAAPRFNNYRPYVVAGLTPSLNLNGKTTDYIMLKPYQTFAEIGIGFDRYLPYFKCRPELKFMFGLGNALDKSHVSSMKDITSIAHAKSISTAKTRMFTLTFFFE